MKVITTHSFKNTLKDIHKNTENRRFCFVIGAGASRKSGILTGGELASKWFTEIKERLEDNELTDWIKEKRIDEKDLAASYGSIYRKRFENDKTSGYEFLVQAMKSARPSYGHIVLAQILSRTAGHCVLTTNFDSLVESSVYQFTNKTPLVCGHESLSGYARPSETHPLVIKIHRDLLLEPKSDPDEINKLDKGWKEPLDHIFSTHIPIIIGYGGNDGSLMNYFENMNKPSNFFWCDLDSNDISERIKKLINIHDGIFVTIKGFDELLYELLWVFDEIKPINDELNDITNERILIATKQLEEITTINIIKDKKTKKVTVSKKDKKELSALEYSDLAAKENDYEKRKKIYLNALDKYPDTGWLWWSFTYFLHFTKKDYAELDKYYKRALELNKNKAGILDNYALYLESIKKDYTKAEEYYFKALAVDPNNAITNGNYALYLESIKKDYTKAEEYYLKALAADPNNANNNGNFALYLENIKRDYTKAEKYFLKALAIEPDHAIFNSSYALYLENIKRDYTKAEKYFLKALAADPDNADINGNYANHLHFIIEDYAKAEEYYLKALTSNPNHANNNSNYASYLHFIKKDYSKAEEYFLNALTIEPDNAIYNINYSQLLLKLGKKKKAQEYLQKAYNINKDENDTLIELWFYRYAHFPKFLSEAENKIEELLNNGIRSIGWDFSGNIERAIKDGHPNPKKLKEFAKRITTE